MSDFAWFCLMIIMICLFAAVPKWIRAWRGTEIDDE